jgi:DNA-binding XRE family transcriptional regulator
VARRSRTPPRVDSGACARADGLAIPGFFPPYKVCTVGRAGVLRFLFLSLSAPPMAALGCARWRPGSRQWTSRSEWRFALQAMSVETRIGKRLAAIREHGRMSQADLAAALGVSKAAIGHYEHGRVRLTVPRLEQLASAALCAPCAAAATDRQATSCAGAGVRLGCRRRDGRATAASA